MLFPLQWLKKEKTFAQTKGTIMVIGETSAGKSTLIQMLLKFFLESGRRVAVVDADLGQATFGPPSSLSLTLWEKVPETKNLPEVAEKNSFGGYCFFKQLDFIGSFSPSGFLVQVVVGVKGLVDRAYEQGVDLVLLDTSGLVRGREGLLLKEQKIKLVKPAHLLVLQKKQELKTLLEQVPPDSKMKIHSLKNFPQARRRSPSERRKYRLVQFSAYFQNSRPRWIHLTSQRKLWFRHPPVKGGLIGLGSKNGDTLALGVICRLGKNSLEVLTPLQNLRGFHRIETSSIKMDKVVWLK